MKPKWLFDLVCHGVILAGFSSGYKEWSMQPCPTANKLVKLKISASSGPILIKGMDVARDGGHFQHHLSLSPDHPVQVPLWTYRVPS